MVEHRAIERLGGGREPAGRAAIGVARPRVAARVVVGEHDPGAAVLAASAMISRSGKSAPVSSPSVARDVQAARLLVDMRDPQAFARGIRLRQATGKEVAGGR